MTSQNAGQPYAQVMQVAPLLVGQVAAIAGGTFPIHYDSTGDYLITGTLAPIASYPNLETTNIGLCVAAGLSSKRALTSTESMYGVVYAGTTYYVVAQNDPIKYSTDTTTWNAVTVIASAPTNSDAIQFGTYLMDCDSTGTNCGYTLNGVRTAEATLNAAAVAMSFGINTAQSLAVALASATVCYTATTANGGWTARVNTLTNTITGHVNWSQAGSLFNMFTIDGKAWSSANGFTQTDRGVIAGINAIAVIPLLPLKSQYSANTATATLTSAMATPISTGVSVPHLIRTTNGTSFTATPWTTVLGLDSRVSLAIAPRLCNVAGVIFVWSAPKNSQLTGFIYKSADSGVTWSRVATPMFLPISSTGAFISFSYANGLLFGTHNDSINKSYLQTYASTLPATHVGQSRAEDLSIIGSYTAGTSIQVPYYVRVK